MLGMYADFSPSIPSEWASASVADFIPSEWASFTAIEGKIALIERSAIREAGMRNWVEPVKQAHAAGAVGVIFVNTDDELVEHAMEATGLVKALDARVVFRRTVDGKDEDGALCRGCRRFVSSLMINLYILCALRR